MAFPCPLSNATIYLAINQGLVHRGRCKRVSSFITPSVATATAVARRTANPHGLQVVGLLLVRMCYHLRTIDHFT